MGLLGDGQDLDLHGGKPRGEAALGLLDEVGHEAVERAQNGAVQHDGGLLGAVLVDVLQVELGRQAEIELAGGQGVLVAHGRLDVDVELGAVEGGLTDLLGEVDAQLGQNLAKGALGLLPHLVVLMVLVLVLRVAQRKDAAVVGDAKVLVDAEDEVAHARDLGLDLVGGHEDVRVVLTEVTAALDALERSARLVAEVVRDLGQTDGQLLVGVGLVGVDHHVVRAVHGAKDEVLALHLHGREHVLLVVVPVAARAVQVHGAHAGREDVLVAQGRLLVADVGLELLPDDVAVGEEHGQTLAHQVVGHEEVHLATDLAVVALSGLGQLLQVLVELGLRGEGGAVDAGEHLVLGVVLPVGAGDGKQLESLEGLGVTKVRAGAHVDILALGEEADLGVFGQVGDVLDLVALATLLHEGDGLLAGQDGGLDREVLLHDLAHLGLDGGEVLVTELGVAQVDVVIEALLGGRAVAEARLRVETLDCLGQNVGGRVANDLQLLFSRALGNGSVCVHDVHWITPLRGIGWFVCERFYCFCI